MSTIQIAKLIAESRVDGPGQRTAVFFQGCSIRCPGCQNPHLWGASGGIAASVMEVVRATAYYAGKLPTPQVTIEGGEPFDQPQALAELVYRLRVEGIEHIIVYTGYTWEQLFDIQHPAYPYLKSILENVDILVDGPFLASQDDDQLTYRGSRNQRPIDVPESLCAGEVVTLDWDQPEVIISPDGLILLPIGLASELDLGAVSDTRRCGQTR